MDYQLTKDYFSPGEQMSKAGALPFLIPGGFAILYGFVFLALGISAISHEGEIIRVIILSLIGLVLLAAGVGLVVAGILKLKKIKDFNSHAKCKVSDNDYDDMVQRYLENIKSAQALDALGLDPDEVNEIAPVTFGGYRFKGADKVKLGSDGLYRTDSYETVMIFFSANDIHCYTAKFKTSKASISEATDVYFYRDVVSVSTVEEEEEYNNKSIPMQKFVLRTTGGTSLTVSLNKTADTDRSINAMRNLLREKKQSMA